MHRQTSVASALGAWIGVAIALLSGCSEGRFPVCNTNADCEAREAGAGTNICFAMRCVECRYDTDCAAGQVCSGTQTCTSISEAPATSAAKEEAAPSWEPGSATSAKGKAPKKPKPAPAPAVPPPPGAKTP